MTTMEMNDVAAKPTAERGWSMALWHRRWRERRRERATLMELSRMQAYLLRDMGFEPGDVYDALDGNRSSMLLNQIRKRGHRSR